MKGCYQVGGAKSSPTKKIMVLPALPENLKKG